MSNITGDSIPPSNFKKCDKFRKMLLGKDVDMTKTGCVD